jgi:hypothetical protein
MTVAPDLKMEIVRADQAMIRFVMETERTPGCEELVGVSR